MSNEKSATLKIKCGIFRFMFSMKLFNLKSLFVLICCCSLSMSLLSQELVINTEYSGPNPITGVSTVRVIEGGSVSSGYEIFADVIIEGGSWDGAEGHGSLLLLEGNVSRITNTFTSVTISGGTVEEIIELSSPIEIDGGELLAGLNCDNGIQIRGDPIIHSDVIFSGVASSSSMIFEGGTIIGNLKVSMGGAIVVRDQAILAGDLILENGGVANISGGQIQGKVFDAQEFSGSKRIFVTTDRSNLFEIEEGQYLLTGAFRNNQNIGGYDGLEFSLDSRVLEIDSNLNYPEPILIIQNVYSGIACFEIPHIKKIEILEGGYVDYWTFGFRVASVLVDGGTLNSAHFETSQEVIIRSGEIGRTHSDGADIQIEGGVVRQISGKPMLTMSGGEVLGFIDTEYQIEIGGDAHFHGNVFHNHNGSGGNLIVSGGKVDGNVFFEQAHWGHLQITGGEIKGNIIVSESRPKHGAGQISGGILHGALIIEEFVGGFFVTAQKAAHLITGEIFGTFEDGTLIGGEDGLSVIDPFNELTLISSEPWETPIFTRSDTNQDGRTNISDIYSILNYLFKGISIKCEAAADFDNNSIIDLGDVILSLSFIYLGAAPPEYPYPNCAPLSSDSFFDCELNDYCLN